MAKVTSNLQEIGSILTELARPVDFTRSDRGKALLDLLADRIRERTVGEQAGPDGAPLKRLAESTLERKRELGQPETISVATGEMMKESNVRGEQAIAADMAEITFGTSEEARDHAELFQEPPGDRPFFDLDERDELALDDFVDECIEDTIRRLGGS